MCCLSGGILNEKKECFHLRKKNITYNSIHRNIFSDYSLLSAVISIV